MPLHADMYQTLRGVLQDFLNGQLWRLLNDGNRCTGATQDTASPAAVGHLRVGVWVAANPMDSNGE